MRNKKGFTLVELVIVIAVIAILAGVMIGTFASVVKSAKKSAEQQEMAAAKQEQVANDVLEKLNNQNWLGWEDFEEKLAKSLSNVNVTVDGAKTEETVKAAVTAALNEYAAAHPSTGTTNTGLTEQQVKYIIENALSGQLTAEQVKAIVNNAVSSTSTLTKSQVQAIVDAAVGKTVTASQVKEAVDAVIKANKVGTSTLTVEDIEKTVNSILNKKSYSTLTEKEVEKIVKEALKDYSVEAKSVATTEELKKAFEKNDKVTNVVVKLTDDMDLTNETDVLKIQNNTVLDLGNKTITAAVKNAITVSEGVTVTIKGDGKIVSEDKGDENRIIKNEGNLVIEGGTFVAGASEKATCAAIQNANIMTINGGDFSLNDGAYYLIYSFNEGTTVINGGTFTSPTPVATNGSDSLYTNLIINGGTFNGTSATSPVIFIPAGTVSIYGGTFNAKVEAACICGGNVNIYGGKFVTTATATESKTAYNWEQYTSNENFVVESHADIEKIDWQPNDGARVTNTAFLVCVARDGYAQRYVENGSYSLFISNDVEIDTVASSKVMVCTLGSTSVTKTVQAKENAKETKDVTYKSGSEVIDAENYSTYNITIKVE